MRMIAFFSILALILAGCGESTRFTSGAAGYQTNPEAAAKKMKDSFDYQEAILKAELLRKPNPLVERYREKLEDSRRDEELKWKEFVAEMKEGDELWFYRDSQERNGYEGFGIYRFGKKIDEYVWVIESCFPIKR